MKTARFSDVVDRCGRPENYLLLTAPAKDRPLQNAIKQQRVLTIHREHVGTRKDYGVVGFEQAAHAQYLLFPHSLKPFADRRVIGIRYELLAEATPAKPRRETTRSPSPAAPSRPAAPPTSTPPRRPAPPATPSRQAPNKPAAKPAVTPAPPAAPPPAAKLPSSNPPRESGAAAVSRAQTAPSDGQVPSAEVWEEIRRAVEELEDGKAVAAYKRLQSLLATPRRHAGRS